MLKILRCSVKSVTKKWDWKRRKRISRVNETERSDRKIDFNSFIRSELNLIFFFTFLFCFVQYYCFLLLASYEEWSSNRLSLLIPSMKFPSTQNRGSLGLRTTNVFNVRRWYKKDIIFSFLGFSLSLFFMIKSQSYRLRRLHQKILSSRRSSSVNLFVSQNRFYGRKTIHHNPPSFLRKY